MSDFNFWATLIASVITIITGLITIVSAFKKKHKTTPSAPSAVRRNTIFGYAGMIIVAIALPLTAYSSLGRIFPGLYGPEWTDQVDYLIPESGRKGAYITREFTVDYPKGTKVISADCKFAWTSWTKTPKTRVDTENNKVICSASHRKHDFKRVVSMRVCYSRSGKGECP